MCDQQGGSPGITRARNRAHGGHAGKSRHQAKHDASKNVSRGACVFTALDQTYRLEAECRKGGESATESDDQERSQLGRGLHVEQIAHEDAYEKAAGDVYEHRADWKLSLIHI